MIRIMREKWYPFYTEGGIEWENHKGHRLLIAWDRPFVSFHRGMYIMLPTLATLVAATNALGGKSFKMNGEHRRVFRELQDDFRATDGAGERFPQARGAGSVHIGKRAGDGANGPILK